MNPICMWILPGSAPALYLGAGVGSGVLVLLLLLIGGVLKCLQSKRDPAIHTEPVYAMMNKLNRSPRQQDDTIPDPETQTPPVPKKTCTSESDGSVVENATAETPTTDNPLEM
ncbi:T-cell-interacting, activating receptor on myeloid cells protein 1-like [Acipenser oxyrinchus oxyrinchus]|nr:T-cell-interacting, activating receptor on myeloid cells protein 1-like [Acipenser oxyrinchus oxyrinchus]